MLKVGKEKMCLGTASPGPCTCGHGSWWQYHSAEGSGVCVLLYRTFCWSFPRTVTVPWRSLAEDRRRLGPDILMSVTIRVPKISRALYAETQRNTTFLRWLLQEEERHSHLPRDPDLRPWRKRNPKKSTGSTRETSPSASQIHTTSPGPHTAVEFQPPVSETTLRASLSSQS